MRLKHGRLGVELHELQAGEGPSLLLLHALYGSSADWGEPPLGWPGTVYAVDFCGHGRSDWIRGGAYYTELLLGDADAALARVGEASIAGAGFGAYVAVLLAGARRDAVPGVLLLPGVGLAGGGPQPDFSAPPRGLSEPSPAVRSTLCDPAVCILEREVRPPDYVAPIAARARRIVLLEDGAARPPWWQTVAGLPSARRVTGVLGSALALLASTT